MTKADTFITIAAGGILAFVAYKTLFRQSVPQRQAILDRTGNPKLAALGDSLFGMNLTNTLGAGQSQLWPDTEAAYQGTWTANGPLDLKTYDKQIWD